MTYSTRLCEVNRMTAMVVTALELVGVLLLAAGGGFAVADVTGSLGAGLAVAGVVALVAAWAASRRAL